MPPSRRTCGSGGAITRFIPATRSLSLARTYHTTAKQIEEANHLDGAELEADAKLVIPVAPGKHPANDTATYARRITRYKVHAGDTVESVADNFGVSAQMLRRWNGIRGDSLRGRRVVALASSHFSERSPMPKSFRRAPRQSVRRPKPRASNRQRPSPRRSNASSRPRRPYPSFTIKVKSGETFYSIASAYRTTVAAIKRDNRNIGVLHPGMILVVPLAR